MTDRRPARHRALLWIGSFGPLGHLPASGTVTVALVGVGLYRLLSAASESLYVAVTLLVTAAAVAIHDVGDRLLGEHDSRTLVWDEVAGFLWAVAFLPFTPRLALLAVIVERTIDIVKVPPARAIDRRWRGGFGAVADDLVAGLYTLAILHLVAHLAPRWVGVG